MSSKKLLTFTEFSTTIIVDSELCHDGINDDNAEVTGGKLLNQVEDDFVLMLGIDDTDVDDIVISEVLVD
jgi:hypothetical protein